MHLQHIQHEQRVHFFLLSRAVWPSTIRIFFFPREPTESDGPATFAKKEVVFRPRWRRSGNAERWREMHQQCAWRTFLSFLGRIGRMANGLALGWCREDTSRHRGAITFFTLIGKSDNINAAECNEWIILGIVVNTRKILRKYRIYFYFALLSSSSQNRILLHAVGRNYFFFAFPSDFALIIALLQ